MNPFVIVSVVLAIIALGLLVLLLRTKSSLASLADRLKPILDVESEAKKIRELADQRQRDAERIVADLQAQTATIREKYARGKERLTQLETEVNALEENLENIQDGFYRPHFTYEDSESYKSAIEKIRDQQKEIAKSGRATRCSTTWQVGGSAREGEKMVRQTEKLLLRAFNAEAEAAVSNVSWNNYQTMKARIEKAKEVLNKHGTVLQVSLTDEYCNARLKELQLVYEASEKKKQERDEQREQRIALKEEERVQRELAKAKDDAEKDEQRYEKALKKAREELSSARDEEKAAMDARITQLESALAEAHTRKERAIAQAQLTRVGHVYIISNIGAFGEGVVKIGMTRRLEPEERVKELGDASVPFPFDVHALIYSDDAPGLETRLHNHFWDRRLNWSNDRKEFFKVELEELQLAVKELGLTTELQWVPEAREYRETTVLRDAKSNGKPEQPTIASTLPDDPFE